LNALLTNIRLARKNSRVTNGLAYFAPPSATKKKVTFQHCHLSAEGLKPGLFLAKLLDVEPVGEHREVGKDGPVAVDLGGVDFVESAEAREVQSRVELGAGNFQLSRRSGKDED